MEIKKKKKKKKKSQFYFIKLGFDGSSLHRLVNLMKGDYYAYVEKIKYNMSRIDILITFVTLHSIIPICSLCMPSYT